MSATRRFRGIVAVALFLLTIVSAATAKYSGGTGEPNDPYQIATAADLIALGETPTDYDKHFLLTADIDLDPNLPGRKVFDKAVIAPDTDPNDEWSLFQGTSFTGVFDGNGHAISHLRIMGKNYVGLFGQLGLWDSHACEVKNLGVMDVNITGLGCSIGGLVGWNLGTVTKCYSVGVVSGGGEVGGLVGANGSWVPESGAVTQCYSTGTVSGLGAAGGLIGQNSGNVSRCYSAATVSGGEAGGLVGCNWDGSVSECYSTGAISGANELSTVGGLVGHWNDALMAACFWDTQTSGQTTSDGGTGKTTAEMQTAKTFLDAGWDFVGETANGSEDIWNIGEGLGYPRLSWEKYSGGRGTADDPYQIAAAADLIALGETPADYDKHFILTADIDLDPNLPGRKVFDKAVIAANTTEATNRVEGAPFTGIFDGGGHTVSRLTIKGFKGGHCMGLFGRLESGAEVKNLGVVDVNITGSGTYVGGLTGYNLRGTVTHCYSTGAVSGDISVGGLVGANDGTITNSYATGSVAGDSSVGGLAGTNGYLNQNTWWADHPGAISNCYSAGAVGGNNRVGGLVGENSSWLSVATNCYSACSVRGNADVGGLAGYINGSVSNSYSTGTVSGKDLVGGLAGYAEYRSAVEYCFWDTQTSAQTTSAGGTGKATGEMQTASTFLDAGWDFVGETANGTDDIWWINEGKGYPRLSWQGPAGMVFVDIPAGTFQMGDHDGVGYEGERPVHAVTLNGFQMSKYETTNAQYAEYLNAAMAGGLIQVVNGVVYASSDANLAEPYCWTYGSDSWSQIEYSQDRFTVRSRDGMAMSDHPMVCVSWYGAKAFCDYYGWRLPTEAEWEYAARGGYDDPYYQYPWGSNTIDCTKANYYNGSSYYCNPLNLTDAPYTSPVGYYGPQGAYGLCDMSGNMWEWCQDWYDDSYYSVSPEGNPTGPDAGWSRVLRGGSWLYVGSYCRVSSRFTGLPVSRGYNLYGFRVCR